MSTQAFRYRVTDLMDGGEFPATSEREVERMFAMYKQSWGGEFRDMTTDELMLRGFTLPDTSGIVATQPVLDRPDAPVPMLIAHPDTDFILGRQGVDGLIDMIDEAEYDHGVDASGWYAGMYTVQEVLNLVIEAAGVGSEYELRERLRTQAKG